MEEEEKGCAGAGGEEGEEEEEEDEDGGVGFVSMTMVGTIQETVGGRIVEAEKAASIMLSFSPLSSSLSLSLLSLSFLCLLSLLLSRLAVSAVGLTSVSPEVVVMPKKDSGTHLNFQKEIFNV